MGLAALDSLVAVVLLLAIPVAMLAGCTFYLARIGRDLVRLHETIDELLEFLIAGADADDR